MMDVMIHGSMEDEGGCRVDVNELREGLLLGMRQLTARCYRKSQEHGNIHRNNNDDGNNENNKNSKRGNVNTGISIAAATSLALCLINRFMTVYWR